MKTSKAKLSALTLAILPLMFVSKAQANTPKIYDDSVIVVFKESASKSDKRLARNAVSASIFDANSDEVDDRFENLLEGRIANLKVSGKSVKQALKILGENPAVDYVEPNYVWSTAAVPDDPMFEQMWGFNNTGQTSGVVDADIDAPEAWEITTGSSEIVIGIIDTGVDYNHEDLAANMWRNPGEIPGDGIDNDGNGYIDDVYGIDTANRDSDPFDDNFHGTHVAGTIGAVGNNGIGVVGVSHQVSIAACKFLDYSGIGSTTGALECIDYFTALKNAGVNVRATNNSWGGGGFSQVMEEAITASGEADILFVAAAGNAGSDNDASPNYPSNYKNDSIIAVASVGSDDGDVGHSYGLESVDIAAPGGDILSTMPNDTYGVLSGTSMATPHVSGAAALVWSLNPALTALEMKELLMNSGDVNAYADGRTVSGKRLNVNNAIVDADPEPGFLMKFSSSYKEIVAGEKVTFSFKLDSILGFDEEITLSLEEELGLGTLSTTTAKPGDVVTLEVVTEADTQWGIYRIAVNATSGDIENSKTIRLSILPQGMFVFPYDSTDTPIPTISREDDPDYRGTNSIINISDDLTVFGISVSVDISHASVGDVVLTLISPNGTSEQLRANQWGDEKEIIETYTSEAFNRESAAGDWTLNIIDIYNGDDGTLNSWRLDVKGIGDVGPIAPKAAFSFTKDALEVTFINESSDANVDIVGHHWDFGDGTTSTDASPTHAFSEAGVYNVTLTTTDAEGQSGSQTQAIGVSTNDIKVTVESAMRSRFGNLRVDLSYMGTDTETVKVYRNGTLHWTGANTGIYRDRERRTTELSFTYVVCDEFDTCSEPEKIAF